MVDLPERSDELTPEELEALATWRAPEPPPGTPSRVALLYRRRQRRRSALRVGIGTALAAGLLFVLLPAPPAGGSLVATVASHTTLGEAVSVEADPGSRLVWTQDVVHQDRGRVVYRVADRDDLRVETPVGAVVLPGRSSVSVEVKTMDVKSVAAGVAMGAIVAGVLVVVVLDGNAEVVGICEDQPAALAQGQERTLTMPTEAPEASPASAAKARAGSPEASPVDAAKARGGSPEEVVARAMAAALEKDEPTGWRRFVELLHPSQTGAQSLASWRRFNFAAFRRKVHLYLPEDRSIRFHIDRTEERAGERVKLFIENRGSDLPTPCQLRKDDQGRWRIEMCSL